MTYWLNFEDLVFEPKLSFFPGMGLIVRAGGWGKRSGVPLGVLTAFLRRQQVAGRPLVLNLDRLVSDQEIGGLLAQIGPFLPYFQAVRVMDPGLGAALVRTFSQVAIELSLEQGIPNGLAVLAWARAMGVNLRKLILSNQIPVAEIANLTPKLNLACELLVLGPVETFYSPRKLLSPLLQGEARQGLGTAEDRPKQHFPLYESEAGTLVYHDKDLYLLDRLDQAEEAGITDFRVSLVGAEQFDLAAAHWQGKGFDPALKQAWPNKTTKGFFLKNRTDKPLARLVNSRLQGLRGLEVAQVLEGKAKQYTLLEIKEKITLPMRLKQCNPEGRETIFTLETLTGLQGEAVANPVLPGIYRTAWIKAALPKSLILPYEPSKDL